MQKNSIPELSGPAQRPSGFSLVELMIAIAIFLVIGAAAINLVKQHVPLMTSQQNQSGLNMNIRNAVAQIQTDAVNAGTGYYPGANIPAFPIGITIFNCGNPNTPNIQTNGCNSMASSSADCFNASTFTYGDNCFDTLNIITVDPNIPPAHPNSATSCVSTTSSTLDLTPPPTTDSATMAGLFHTGDELLLLKGDGSQITTTILSAPGKDSGGKVHLEHNQTATDGSNSSDLLGIANSAAAANNKLGVQFCNNDWVLKLAPVTYTVDTTNPADPQLKRWTNFGSPAAVGDVVADQVIGFKVGAMAFAAGQDQTTYLFNAPAATPTGTAPLGGCTSNCGYNDDFSLVRSVLVSIIGRTPSNPTDPFRNNFDKGPYKVESVSVVINPRNLSMNDQ